MSETFTFNTNSSTTDSYMTNGEGAPDTNATPLITAPTNMSYVITFLGNYKSSLEQKDVNKYLSCFSKAFSKKMVDTSQGYTNQYYLTYNDIETGVKADQFSQYQGKTVSVSYIIQSVTFNTLEVTVNLQLTVQAGSDSIKQTNEVFLLLWNDSLQCWELESF